MKRTTAIICLFLGCLFVVIAVSAILMVKQPNEAENQAENTEHELPTEIMTEIERLHLEPEIHMTRWSGDAEEKRIDIFVWKLTPENEQLNGTAINGWTILVIDDVELRLDVEKLNAELERLKEIPEMQIGAWSSGWDPITGYRQVEIFVDNLTPENQQLHGTTIDGWKIYVYKSLIPPKVVALRDPRIKEKIEGKEYEIDELTKQADRELLVDVYIYIKEPEKTIIATVDVIKGEVIELNETSSWVPIPGR